MSNRDRDGDQRPKQFIYKMRERVQHVRNRLRREQKHGEVTDRTHLDLAEVVIEYNDVLCEHQGEKAVRDNWPDISDIENLFGQKASFWEEAPGDTDNKRQVAKPAILQITTERLLQASRELDAAAKRLGFAAAVKSEPDVFGVDPEWEDDADE